MIATFSVNSPVTCQSPALATLASCSIARVFNETRWRISWTQGTMQALAAQ